MYNWSVDTNELKKYPKKYNIWKLEQLINFGLGSQKLNKKVLKKYLGVLNIDEEKRTYLKFLLEN